MQEVHLICPVETVTRWVNYLQKLVDQQEEAVLVDFGCSQKRQMGYIVLCWANKVDSSVMAQLQNDPTIEDFCTYTIPGS